jgi:hypothetical protein
MRTNSSSVHNSYRMTLLLLTWGIATPTGCTANQTPTESSALTPQWKYVRELIPANAVTSTKRKGWQRGTRYGLIAGSIWLLSRTVYNRLTVTKPLLEAGKEVAHDLTVLTTIEPIKKTMITEATKGLRANAGNLGFAQAFFHRQVPRDGNDFFDFESRPKPSENLSTAITFIVDELMAHPAKTLCLKPLQFFIEGACLVTAGALLGYKFLKSQEDQLSQEVTHTIIINLLKANPADLPIEIAQRITAYKENTLTAEQLVEQVIQLLKIGPKPTEPQQAAP